MNKVLVHVALNPFFGWFRVLENLISATRSVTSGMYIFLNSNFKTIVNFMADASRTLKLTKKLWNILSCFVKTTSLFFRDMRVYMKNEWSFQSFFERLLDEKHLKVLLLKMFAAHRSIHFHTHFFSRYQWLHFTLDNYSCLSNQLEVRLA